MSDIKSCIHRRRQYLVKEINDQKRSDLNYELKYVIKSGRKGAKITCLEY